MKFSIKVCPEGWFERKVPRREKGSVRAAGRGPGVAMGPLKGRGRMEDDRERVPAAAALAGAAPSALSEPAPRLQAQPRGGSLSCSATSASGRSPRTVPARAAVPARRHRACLAPPPRPPGKSPRWPRSPRPDPRRWGRGGSRSTLRGAQLPGLQGAPGNASEHNSHPPGAREQRPLCSRSVPLPGSPESRGCGVGEGEETGQGRYPASA